MQENGFGVGACPARLSKHSPRKEECGARPGHSKNSPGPAAHSSASFGTARSQASGQAQAARAVQEPETVPGWQGQSVQFSPSLPSCAGAWGTSGPGDPETQVRRGCKNTRNVLGVPACSSFPVHSLSLPLSLEESRDEVPPAQSLPRRLGNVWGTFFQTLVAILVLQERKSWCHHGCTGERTAGSPTQTRRIGSTRGECLGLPEVSQGTAPPLYPSYNGPWTCSQPWTQSNGHDPWVTGPRCPCSSRGLEMTCRVLGNLSQFVIQ